MNDDGGTANGFSRKLLEEAPRWWKACTCCGHTGTQLDAFTYSAAAITAGELRGRKRLRGSWCGRQVNSETSEENS